MRRLVAAVFVVGSMAACKAEVATVELSPAASTLAAAGATAQLTAVSKDKDGKELKGRTVTFKSSSDAVATVNEAGLVTAKSDGEVTVTATDMEKSAGVKVFVAIPSKVEILPGAIALKTGEAAVEVQARVLDGRGRVLTDKTVTFTLDKPAVAKLDGNKVAPAGVGMATLTATWDKLSATAAVLVSEGTAAPAPAAAAPAPAAK